MDREQAVKYLQSSGFSEEQIKAIEGAFSGWGSCVPVSEKVEGSEDCISRQAVLDGLANIAKAKARSDAQKALMGRVMFFTEKLPSVNPQETVTEFADRCRECGKMKRCKDCKYFEYDSVAKVDGIPLIVAHEICSKWGDGCKTSENGCCFLFEPKEGGKE